MQELSYTLSALLSLASPSLPTDLSRLRQTTEGDHHQAMLYCEQMKYNYDILIREIDSFADTFRKNSYIIEENRQSVQLENCKLKRQIEDGQHEHRINTQELQQAIKELKYHLDGKDEKIRELHDKLEEETERREETERAERELLRKYEGHFETQAAALQNSLIQIVEMEKRLKEANEQCERNIELSRILQHTNYTLTQELQHTRHQLIQLWKTYQEKSEKNPSECSPIPNKSALIIGEMQSLKKPFSPHNLNDILNEVGCTDNIFRKSVSSADKENHSQNKGTKLSSDQWKIQTSEPFCMEEEVNPYYFTFLIIGQNAKIKSKRFEEISEGDCTPFWKKIVEEKIPMHDWQHKIEDYLVSQL